MVRASNSLTASLSRGRGIMISQGNLAVLPDRTGGRVIKNTNTPEARVPDILAESGSYYLLGFEPATPRDGKPHRIQVKVNRRGVSVTTRRGYVAATTVPAIASAEERAQEEIEGIVARRKGVTLSASAAALLTPRTKEPILAVTIAARHDAGASESRPERVHVVTSVRKMTGDAVRTLTQTLDVTPAEGQESAPGYEVVQRLPIAPGRYEVRVGLEDESRRQSGSVYTFVDVPELKKTHLFLSDVVVEADASAATLAAAGLDDVLPFVPTAQREFLRSAVLSTFLQIHQGTNPPEPVSVTARVVDAGDRLRFEQQGTLDAGSFRSTGIADCAVEVPLSDFQSGEYLLTIQARAGTAIAKRLVRFAVK
jgi:hypothetical protein